MDIHLALTEALGVANQPFRVVELYLKADPDYQPPNTYLDVFSIRSRPVSGAESE